MAMPASVPAAIRLPSGDQAGLRAFRPVVTCRSPVPSRWTTQMSVRPALVSARSLLNAINVPSGENAGSNSVAGPLVTARSSAGVRAHDPNVARAEERPARPGGLAERQRAVGEHRRLGRRGEGKRLRRRRGGHGRRRDAWSKQERHHEGGDQEAGTHEVSVPFAES